MKENQSPAILTHKAFSQIDECKCGKNPFRYHDVTHNVYVLKCSTTKEQFDIKTKSWVPSKKPPCDLFCKYYGERPVFEEIKNIIIKKSQQLKNKDQVLEEKLRRLFQFVFVSRHSATLDEINILVQYSLLQEPRKIYYYPSPGHMRISHYETLEDYRDRIFSKKIVDRSHLYVEESSSFEKITFIDIPKTPKESPPTKAKKQKKVVKKEPTFVPAFKFIVASEDGDSEKESGYSSDEGDPDENSDQYTEYSSESEDPEEKSDIDEIIEPEEELFDEDNFEDYGSGGDNDD
jgi:hypothetical protein